MTADVITSKRLGLAQPNKVRLLLIVTHKADQAQHLTAATKCLCQSSNPAVQDNIHVNRYTTKAKSEAAYHAQVQQQHAALQQTSRFQNQEMAVDVNNLGMIRWP